MIDRFDFIFSYWIFIWYILYELKIVSYNPKGALVFALVENLILLGLLFYYSYPHILTFCILNFFIKVVPLWRVLHTPYTIKDVYATFVLLLIYFVWLGIHKANVIQIFKHQIENIKNKQPIGPLLYVLFSSKYYK